MVEQLSKKVAYGLVENDYLQKEHLEDYVYSLTCFIETCISVLILLSLGAALKEALPTLLFIAFFSEIKKRCGGLHVNTYIGCLFGTCVIYVLFITVISPVMIKNMNVTLFSLLIAFVILEILGAVNHPGVGWLKNEYKESKHAARLIVLLETLIISVLYILQANNEVIVYLVFAVCLNAILLLIAKIKEEM